MVGKKYFYLFIVVLAIQACSSKKSDVLVGKYEFLFSPAPENSISVAGIDNNYKSGNSVLIKNWSVANYQNTNYVPNIALNYKTLELKKTLKVRKNNPSSTSSLLNSILVSEEGVIYTSVSNNTVNALKNNKVIWSKTVDGNIVGLSFDLGFLYLTTDKGGIYGIDAIDGSISWERQMGSTIKTSPLVFETALYVKDTNNSIVSLSIYDGSILWTKAGQKPKIEVKSYNTSASNQFLAVFGLSNGDILGLRRETGQVIWELKTDNRAKINELSSIADIKASPVIFNNHVFVSTYSNKSVYINAKTGELVWSNKVGSVLNPIITPNRIFVLDRSNMLVSINKKDGLVVWNLDLNSLPLSNNKNISWFNPLLVNSDIMLANSNGDILFLSAVNKSVKYQIKVKNGIIANPVIYNNQLIVMTKKGELLIYESNA